MSALTPPPKLLTAREVAAILGVSLETVYQWSSRGTVPTVHLGKRVRFSAEVIDKIAREGLGA